MQIEGLIPLRSSIDQAIASLYFLRILSSCCSSILFNAADIITGFSPSGSKKEYFRRLGNSFNINLSALVSCSVALFSLLHEFSVLFSIKLQTVSMFLFFYAQKVPRLFARILSLLSFLPCLHRIPWLEQIIQAPCVHRSTPNLSFLLSQKNEK